MAGNFGVGIPLQGLANGLSGAASDFATDIYVSCYLSRRNSCHGFVDTFFKNGWLAVSSRSHQGKKTIQQGLIDDRPLLDRESEKCYSLNGNVWLRLGTVNLSALNSPGRLRTIVSPRFKLKVLDPHGPILSMKVFENAPFFRETFALWMP